MLFPVKVLCPRWLEWYTKQSANRGSLQRVLHFLNRLTHQYAFLWADISLLMFHAFWNSTKIVSTKAVKQIKLAILRCIVFGMFLLIRIKNDVESILTSSHIKLVHSIMLISILTWLNVTHGTYTCSGTKLSVWTPYSWWSWIPSSPLEHCMMLSIVSSDASEWLFKH